MPNFVFLNNNFTTTIANFWNHKPKLTNNNHKQSLKKRHWFLGSMVILIGSWITHTTTATISDDPLSDETLNFILLEDFTQHQSFAARSASINKDIKRTALEEIHVDTLSLYAEATRERYTEITHEIKKGESLGSIFRKLDLDLSTAHYINEHEIAKQLVSIDVGRSFTFKFDDKDNLKQITYPVTLLEELIVDLDGNNITSAKTLELPFKLEQHHASGEIKNSLYESAADAGLTNGLIMDMVYIFGWDIDFVQDIRQGDTFHVVYDNYNLNGEKLKDGNILAAEFTTQGTTYRALRFVDDNGIASYYTPEGKSMLGTFLRTPVKFSRISSGFGTRKHPILKTWRAHNGVDYAASTGTPILATASGKVIHAGTKGGYGRTVILRHAGKFTTLYGHMSKLGAGIRNGSTVQQGDVIGYIGSSGLATGPHLHYEFRVDGVHQNPLTYKLPKASSIAETSRDKFTQMTIERLAQLDTAIKSYHLAKSNDQPQQTSKL